MTEYLRVRICISAVTQDPVSGDCVDQDELVVWGNPGHQVYIYIEGKELGPFTINEEGAR